MSGGPVGVAFDGANIWVTDFYGTVTELRAGDGVTIAIVTGLGSAFGIAFDGTNLWVTSSEGQNSVTKILASNASIVGTYLVGTNPHEVAFDGGNVWVANSFDKTVTELRASDGATVGTFATGGHWGQPFIGSGVRWHSPLGGK